MGPVGPTEILVVLVVALIVLGPTRLPEAARSVGRAFREFRRVTGGFQDELRGALEPEPDYPTAPTTPAETWVTTEEPASMTTPGSATAPKPAEGNGPARAKGQGRPEGGEPLSSS